MTDNRESNRDPREFSRDEDFEMSSPYDTAPTEEHMPSFKAPESDFDREGVFGEFSDGGRTPEAAPGEPDAPLETVPAESPAQGIDDGTAEPVAAEPPVAQPRESEDTTPAAPPLEDRFEEQVSEEPVSEEASYGGSARVADIADDGELHSREAAAEEADSPLTAPPRFSPDARPPASDEGLSFGGTARVAEDDGEVHSREDDIDNTMVRRTSLWKNEPTEAEVADSDATATFPTGAAAAGSAAAAGAAATTRERPLDRSGYDPARAYEDDILAGEELEAPRSRAGAHIASALLVLLLTPLAWYLITDAGARFTLAENAPWTSGRVNLAAIAEFLGGILIAVVIAFLIKASSLGAWITGTLLTIAGFAFIVAPRLVQDYSEGTLNQLSELHQIGANASHHLIADGSTGRLAAYGIALLLAGFISHAARAAGRRNERLRAAFERRGGAY